MDNTCTVYNFVAHNKQSIYYIVCVFCATSVFYLIKAQVIQWFFGGTFLVTFPQPIRFCPCLFLHCLHNTSSSPLTSTIKKILRNLVFWITPSCCLYCSNATTPEAAVNILYNIFALLV